MRLLPTEKLLARTPACGEIPEIRLLAKNALTVAWPSIVESFLICLVGMIDMMMVGSLGAYAIAAVGLTTQPKLLGLAVFISLNVAVSALIARRRGEQDRTRANQVLGQALLLTFGLILLVTALCLLFANDIIQLAGSSADTHPEAVTYFRIIMGGTVFTALSMVINAAQRGAGNTRIAMRTNLVSNGVNLVFNYLLIGGHFGFPALGVRGAAIATVIGSVCACVMSIRSVADPNQFLHFEGIRDLRFEAQTLRGIARISSSTFAEQCFMRIGFFIYSIVVARLGTIPFAAHQIGINLLTLNFSFGEGLSAAAIALVGRSLGERRPDLANLYASLCQRMGLLFSMLLTLLYLTLGKPLFALFTDDPAVLAFSPMIIGLTIVVVFLQISYVTTSGCLRAAGDTLFVALISLISMAIVRPLSGWFFCYPIGLGLTGAWLGLLSDQILRFILINLRFRSGRWTKIKL